MTHSRTVPAKLRCLALLIPLIFTLAACSSSDGGGVDASSAGPNLPVTSSTAATSTASPAPTSSSSPPSGNGTKAVCARVIKIVQDSSRAAINALTPALQTGDQKKVAAAQTKAEGVYRTAAASLRKEAAKADDAKLGKEIEAAAAYFDKAAHATTSGTSADDSLATLSQTCT